MSCSKRLMRAGRMGTAAGILIACLSAGTASAQQPADDSWMPDRKLYDYFLNAIGLKSKGDNINYRERSPLVVPPSLELPVPEASAKARPPEWPTDPEIREKRELERRQAGLPPATDEEAARPLRPDEIARGRNGRRTTSSEPKTDTTGGLGGDPVSPDKLGYVGGIFNSLWSSVGPKKDEFASFTGEPGRTSLTAPPPGYQTPSPSAPYGLSKTKEKPKAKNFFLEHPSAPN
jgi:hypothetical protein